MIYQYLILAQLALFLGLTLRNLRDYALPPSGRKPSHPEERLFVLIPARNEAENIAACLEGLLAQDWPLFTLLVLDDGSEDGTDRIVARIAAQDGRVRLLRGQPIAPGWAGKVWACRQLGEAALAQGADWLLFLDADTRAQPGLLAALLTHGQTTGAGMVSTFPYQVTGTLGECIVLPMLHFLILTFLPIHMVWKSSFPQLVAACGQVELFSRRAYLETGGHGSIPHSFHDGLQLARSVKRAGLPVRLLDVSPLIACRMYHGGRAVWNGFTRNAYEGLGSVGALVVMTLLQTCCFLLPFVFLAFSIAAIGVRASHLHGLASLSSLIPPVFWGSVAQVGLILLIRLLQARRFGHYGAVWLHPLSIAALVTIQWASFWKSRRKTVIHWKGREYS